MNKNEYKSRCCETNAIKDKPLVSIITTTLNSSKYLDLCVQSVLNQSYPNIEHVFVDGNSTDDTLDILTKYKSMYPGRIRFISEPDKSAGEAWNKGLRMAKGDIFGWLGSDDIYEPDAIKVVVEFFRANPEAYFVFGDCSIIDEKGMITGNATIRDFVLNEAINDACYIATQSAFYKREVIEKIGYFNTGETGVELDYWLRVGKVFKMHRIKKTLSRFRIHKDSISGSKSAFKMYAREGYIVSRRHGGHIFSGYGIRYFGAGVIELLWPVFGRFYPFIYHRVVSPFIRWIGNVIKI